MYRKIIVGLSLEHGIADRALTAARQLADKDASIFAVHVLEPLQGSVRFHVSDDDLEKAKKQTEQELQSRLSEHAGVEGVIIEGHPGRALVDHAEQTGADCIVVASHKPGLGHLLLGSTAARIVRHAQCSVHVLR